MLSNISREKWIAGVFVLFILCVPVLTIFSKLFPQEVDGEDEVGKAVLEGNGTLIGADSEEERESETGSEEEGESESQDEETTHKIWFREFQLDVNDFTDDLYFRDELLALSMAFSKVISGDTYIESTQVLLGKEGWLFYKTENEGDGNPLLDYSGTNHFVEKELAEMAENLTVIRDYLKQEKGIRFVAMCLPNKENMYPEYMPDTIPKLIEQSRADQVAEYIHGNTDLEYIYPKETFFREKEKYRLYYMTDTHWNQIGAFVGLQTFFEQIYGTYASPDSVYFIETGREFTGDLATIAGVGNHYGMDTTYVLDVESVDPAQYHDEVLLIVGDSFSGFFSNVAEPYYKKVYRIDIRDFTMSMIDKYQPDIVVWQTVERRIEILKNENILEK